jgi:hypothetical protein
MRFGIAVSAIWLMVVCIYCWASWSNLGALRPNEVGDLAAGASAPLAFLWLVVAVFLQKDELGLQRQELRQSRRALELQAEELCRLVAQTTKQTEHLEREWIRSELESYFKWLRIDLAELWACVQMWDVGAILEDELTDKLKSGAFPEANASYQAKFRSLDIESILKRSADSRQIWEAGRFAQAATRFCQTFECIESKARTNDLISVLNRLNQEGWVVTRNLVEPFANKEA